MSKKKKTLIPIVLFSILLLIAIGMGIDNLINRHDTFFYLVLFVLITSTAVNLVRYILEYRKL